MIHDLPPDDSADPAQGATGHTPDPALVGSILYVVRLDYFGKLPKSKQAKLIELNPLARKKAPVFYVGQALPESAVRAAFDLARRNRGEPGKREKALAELLRAHGYYVISN
jgi:hypothetical protein